VTDYPIRISASTPANGGGVVLMVNRIIEAGESGEVVFKRITTHDINTYESRTKTQEEFTLGILSLACVELTDAVRQMLTHG